jgi:cell division protein FtsB
VLVALVVIALAALVPTVNSYVAQRQQLSELQSQVSQQEAQVEDLRAQVARWEDPTYVAARARERLLFAMPGETQYRLTDTSGQDVPLTEAQQAEEAAKEGEWFSTLWESVEGSSRLTPEDIPDEPGSTDGDVPEEDPAETTDQDADQ